MQKIVTSLWFDTQAEEAAKFYTSLIKNSKISNVSHYGENMPMPAGTVLTVDFELDGQIFMALNGGPEYKFTPAISLTVNCETQEEIDHLWQKLSSDGGQEVQCGWLNDKFGLAWQIVPTLMSKLMSDPDPVKVNQVMQAMMKMIKLDIKTLQEAYDQA